MPQAVSKTLPEIVYYVAMSLDGRIATSDGGIGWLAPFEGTGEDYGCADFCSSIDAVLLGRTTYEQCLTLENWALPAKPCWVFSRQPLSAALSNVIGTSKSPLEVARELQDRHLRRAWLIGGGKLAASFRAAGLITEMIVSVIPVVLGAGIPLFDGPGPASALSLVETKTYANGIVQMRYTKRP